MAGIGDGEVLHIGDLADKAGVSADTVRYYERLGLLGSPARTAGGYRVYTEADLGRLLFIRRAKLLGLSLDEIRGLLEWRRRASAGRCVGRWPSCCAARSASARRGWRSFSAFVKLGGAVPTSPGARRRAYLRLRFVPGDLCLSAGGGRRVGVAQRKDSLARQT